MKRLILTISVVAVVLPGAALGKGPSSATIDGPGGGGDLRITGCCEPGSAAMKLAEQAGFFPATFGQEPSPMLAGRPRGDLGPRYTITYAVPGPSNETFTIRQDVYPYAKPGPVTHMQPGQPVFDRTTRGGWFQAGPELKQTLVDGGLPASPSAGSGERSFPAFEVFLLLAAALVLVAATAAVLRRRTHPAPAA